MSADSDPATNLSAPYFVGRAENRITPKGQILLPALFRAACSAEILSEGFMLRRDKPDHLNLYPMVEFNQVRARMRKHLLNMADSDGDMAGSLLRKWSASTHFLQLDAQGRLALPREMLASAGIAGPEILFVGCDRRIELWDPAVYAKSEVSDEQFQRFLDDTFSRIIEL